MPQLHSDHTLLWEAQSLMHNFVFVGQSAALAGMDEAGSFLLVRSYRLVLFSATRRSHVLLTAVRTTHLHMHGVTWPFKYTHGHDHDMKVVPWGKETDFIVSPSLRPACTSYIMMLR